MGRGNTVFVTPLPEDVRGRELDDLFGRYGRIRDIDIKTKGRDCFAFVEFDDGRDAEEACYKLEGFKFDGRRLRVELGGGRDSSPQQQAPPPQRGYDGGFGGQGGAGQYGGGYGGGGGGGGQYGAPPQGQYGGGPPQGSGPKCFNCGQFGHISRNCQGQRIADAGPKCYECGEGGHLARACPKRGGGYDDRRGGDDRQVLRR